MEVAASAMVDRRETVLNVMVNAAELLHQENPHSIANQLKEAAEWCLMTWHNPLHQIVMETRVTVRVMLKLMTSRHRSMDC